MSITILCGTGYSWPAHTDFTGVNKQTDRQTLAWNLYSTCGPGSEADAKLQGPTSVVLLQLRAQGLEKPLSKLGALYHNLGIVNAEEPGQAGRTQGANHSGHG